MGGRERKANRLAREGRDVMGKERRMEEERTELQRTVTCFGGAFPKPQHVGSWTPVKLLEVFHHFHRMIYVN